jgi:hypothetical protein
MKKVFLVSGLLATLSLFWVLPYCEYKNTGKCASVEPLVLGVIVPTVWFVVGVVFFLVARFLDKYSRPKAALAVRLSPFILMLVSGVYFLTVESRRKCVIDAIANGDHGKLKNCLDSGASVDSLRYKDWGQEGGPTALYFAVERRDLKALDLLLFYGASVNQYPACHKYAPLRIFSLRGILPTASDDEIRQKLLNAGAVECR